MRRTWLILSRAMWEYVKSAGAGGKMRKHQSLRGNKNNTGVDWLKAEQTRPEQSRGLGGSSSLVPPRAAATLRESAYRSLSATPIKVSLGSRMKTVLFRSDLNFCRPFLAKRCRKTRRAILKVGSKAGPCITLSIVLISTSRLLRQAK